jgi:hypothetical protein
MRRTIPILAILIGLLALWGCSKKSPTQNTGNLNQTQEQAFGSEAQSNAVRATGFVGSFEGGLGSTPDTAKPFGGPAFLLPSQALGPDTVPTGWTGPGPNPHQSSTPPYWYYRRWAWTDTFGTFNDTVYVKFTPNIWDSIHARDTVIAVYWQGLIYWLSQNNTTSTSLDESANVGYSSGGTDITKTDGAFKVVGSVKTGGTTISSYTYNFSWINCTRTGWRGVSRTCSGTITWDARSTYVAVAYDLKGSYNFTGGSPVVGTGEAQFKNLLTGTYITFAKSTFNNNGTGYYTLLSENWQTPHSFWW